MIFSILDQVLVALPLMVGAYMTLSLLKLPDFSLESAYLFGAVLAHAASNLPLPCLVGSAILGGMTVGAIVTTLNQIFKLPYLLAAIITNGLFHGLTQYILGTSMKSFHVSLPLSEHLFLSILVLTLLILFKICLRSQMGYSLAIFGNNPQFFQHHLPRAKYVIYCGVLLGHGCAGISGFLFTLSNGFVDLTINFGIILLCLTALVLGKSFIRSEHPNIFVPVLGLIAYFIVQQSLLHLGLNLKYFNAFQALCLLTALTVLQKKKKLMLDHLGV